MNSKRCQKMKVLYFQMPQDKNNEYEINKFITDSLNNILYLVKYGYKEEPEEPEEPPKDTNIYGYYT